MTWFRTIRGLVPWLVGLFVVAQLAGIVSSDYVYGKPGAMASAHMHDHGGGGHVHDHGVADDHHGAPHDGLIADQCCALHALAGIVPHVVTTVPAGSIAELLLDRPVDRFAGIGPSLLDRPPKSLPSR